MQTNTFIVRQNSVLDGIYFIFAYLIKWLWHHQLTKMTTSITAFLDGLKKIKSVLLNSDARVGGRRAGVVRGLPFG